MKSHRFEKAEMVNLGKRPIIDASRRSTVRHDSGLVYRVWGILELCWFLPAPALLLFVRPIINLSRLFGSGHYLWALAFFIPCAAFCFFSTKDIMKRKLSKATAAAFLVSAAVLIALRINLQGVPIWSWE